MAESARRLRLVILDACRNNPFIGQMRRSIASRSIARGLAPVEREAGTLVVYAAKHGQLALDGDEGHSPFAAALMHHMLTPGVEVRRVFDRVRDSVLAATQRRQQPFHYGSLPGSEDFFFVAGTWANAPSSPPAASAPAANPEQVLKKTCLSEWPGDFKMQVYCEGQQRQALQTLALGRPQDIPQ